MGKGLRKNWIRSCHQSKGVKQNPLPLPPLKVNRLFTRRRGELDMSFLNPSAINIPTWKEMIINPFHDVEKRSVKKKIMADFPKGDLEYVLARVLLLVSISHRLHSSHGARNDKLSYLDLDSYSSLRDMAQMIAQRDSFA